MPAPTNANTADRVIRLAMKDAGLLEEGNDPSPENYADYITRLNDIINYCQTDGLKLWLNSQVVIALATGVGTYTFGPAGAITIGREMRILEGLYTDQNANSRPLIPMSWQEYRALSNPTQQGSINAYFVDKQQLNTVVKLWMVPDATAAVGTCNFLVQRPVTNLINLTDTMEFPQEWFIYLRWALADDICVGQPTVIVNRCAEKAMYYKEKLEAWDVEDPSTVFKPSSQGGYQSRFR
jgi:hypothetical protein